MQTCLYVYSKKERERKLFSKRKQLIAQEEMPIRDHLRLEFIFRLDTNKYIFKLLIDLSCTYIKMQYISIDIEITKGEQMLLFLLIFNIRLIEFHIYYQLLRFGNVLDCKINYFVCQIIFGSMQFFCCENQSPRAKFGSI